MKKTVLNNDYFHSFTSDISSISLPETFTFPFYYQPHRVAILAAEQLQKELISDQTWEHNFGLETDQDGTAIGKMFGVLVVRNSENELGYLSAFSGKVGNSNHHKGFVPPVFDMLEENSFFRIGEVELHEMTLEIEDLESNSDFKRLNEEWNALETKEQEVYTEQKELIKSNRELRLKQREAAGPNPDQSFLNVLAQQSIDDKLVLKDMQRHFQYKKNELSKELVVFNNRISELKENRAAKSADLQQQLFHNYTFLNAELKSKNLKDIFENNPLGIPAGAGECAAPKLLQYAFLNNLEPIALAEFWWGQSPKSEVRVHQNYYPACRGKCEPILGHMLVGLNVDPNPLLSDPVPDQDLQIIYEDEAILVINKPAEFLTVPGKNISDSVYTRIQKIRPDLAGPIIVHRLDMSTSGCLVLAKTNQAYKFLQRQFVKRLVKKRYVALLEKAITQNEGVIDLPMRVDLEDRPRQLICYEHGSNAVTHFKVVEIEAPSEELKTGRTRIHFYPVTGRTHQLRVHAAHTLGLSAPIIGDDLYGTPANRLHLHAEYLEFTHPVTKRTVKFKVKAPF